MVSIHRHRKIKQFPMYDCAIIHENLGALLLIMEGTIMRS